MRLQRRTIKKARIEIIPMIDTIFFLLVFFMISTLSMARYSGLSVNLPKAATGQQPPSDSAAVTISPDGKVTIDKQEVARDQIRAALQEHLRPAGKVAIITKASQAFAVTSYSRVQAKFPGRERSSGVRATA